MVDQVIIFLSPIGVAPFGLHLIGLSGVVVAAPSKAVQEGETPKGERIIT